MALDTRNKRSSAIHVSLPWRGMYPTPDGTIIQADRQAVALMYSGILATGAAAPSVFSERQRRQFLKTLGRGMG